MSKNNNKRNRNGNSKGYAREEETKQHHSNRRGRTNSKTNNRSGNAHDMRKEYGDVDYDANDKLDGKPNDFEWYNKNPGMTKDATKISFFNQLGAKFSFNEATTLQLPGIMAFDMITSPGYAGSMSSPINVAGTSMYEWVRAALNKPNTYYSPADMTIMNLCLDDLHSQYANIKRLFGIAKLWSGYNLYYPRVMLAAGYKFNEVDFQDFIDNCANYLMRFNQLVYRAGFLYYPVNFDLTTRHVWLFSNYFQDHRTSKGQIYIHRKYNYWEFSDTASETGSSALFKVMYNTESGVPMMKQILNHFEECIESLRNSDSIRIMQADMRQAFKGVPSRGMNRIEDDYICPPDDMSDEALLQIENMDVYNMSEFYNLNVVQDVDTECVIYRPWVEAQFFNDRTEAQMWPKLHAVSGNKLINVHWDDPDEKDVCEATRSMVSLITFSATAADLQDPRAADVKVGDACVGVYTPADFCVYVQIYTSPDDPTLDSGYPSVGIDSQVLSGDYLTLLRHWSTFDWAPKLMVFSNGGFYPIWEYDNYTTITGDMLANLNVAMMLSMYSVPQLGDFKGYINK